MVRKWCELVPFYFRATATVPFFFALAPPPSAPPFSVRASGALALKVAQVPSTGRRTRSLKTGRIRQSMSSMVDVKKYECPQN